jgi:E3 ubiquitin-protein ligase HUWE1
VEDLKHYDPQIYNSIKFMAEDPNLNYDEEDFRFTVIREDGEEVELKKGGKDIRVTQETRRSYARLVAKYYLAREVKTELKEFMKGFYQVIPQNVISVFDPDEIEFLMGGAPEIDIDDWQKNTVYKGQFHNPNGGSTHQVVQWFWQILRTLSQDELRKFLLFCTGMPRIPIEGFR